MLVQRVAPLTSDSVLGPSPGRLGLGAVVGPQRIFTCAPLMERRVDTCPIGLVHETLAYSHRRRRAGQGRSADRAPE